jgi:DNA polymerase III sliding clamp (beta) subunit (PCNA family)
MKAVILTDELKRLIKATAKFISKDDNRHMQQYIKLEFTHEGMQAKAVSCDGYRLSIENAKCFDVDESFTVFIKPYLPVGANFEYATIELVDKRCLIDIGGRIVGYKQPDGNYMDINKAIEEIERFPVTHTVSVSQFFLLDALNSIHKDSLHKNPAEIQLRGKIGAISIGSKDGIRYVLPVRR